MHHLRRCSSWASADNVVDRFVDTHCRLDHIYARLNHSRPYLAPTLSKFEMVNNFTSQLDACITAGGDADTLDDVVSYLEHEKVFGSFAVHPFFAYEWENATLRDKIKQLMSHKKCVAWGPCGLQYHEKGCERELQKKVFAEQVQIAVQLNKPLMVYERRATEDAFAILANHAPRDHLIHMQSFTGGMSLLKQFLVHFRNIYFSFSGGVTYNNAIVLRKVAVSVPEDRLLLESDGPLLVPAPFPRTEVSTPDHTLTIAKSLVYLRGTSLDTLLSACRENTKRVYGI